MTFDRTSPGWPRTAVADLAAADLDVLVIGGGIVGAGAALDAVTRGLRVGLVSGQDWAAGRSGHTGTLVHGGLVELSRIGVGAVAALRRERDLLIDRNAPHLVRRVPLLVPLTRGLPERLAVGAALSLYDAAAFSVRQPGVLPGHRQLARRAVLRLVPAIAIADVTGAVQLYEGQVDDARLTITVVRTAVAYGALALARTPVRRLVREDGRVVGAELADPTGTRTVRARCVVLAAGTEFSGLLSDTGTTVPATAAGAASADPSPRRPTSRTEPTSPTEPTSESRAASRARLAVHLVLPRARLKSSTGLVLRNNLRSAVGSAAGSPGGREGDRAVYVVPWGRHWIVGSTAAWSDPEQLLAELNQHLAVPIGADAVESVYTSPAPYGADAGRSPTVQVPSPGLVLVRGSGLAGYRADAERAVDAAVGQLGGLHPPSATRRVPLLGADGFTAWWNQRHLLARRAGVPVLRMEHLLQRYGSGVEELIAEIERRPELAAPLPGAEDYLAVEAWFAVVHEDATELADVLARRTRIAMETWDGGAEAASHVAHLMAAELGWDDEEVSRQISDYLREASAARAGLSDHGAAPG